MRTTEKIPVPENWKELKHHPLACFSEFGTGIDMDSFVASMRDGGFDESEFVTLLDGEILDGRHIHAGAIDADVVPNFRQFIGSDPFRYVCKKILRQHLDASQRAMFAASLVEAKEGRPKTPPIGGVSPKTRSSAAKLLDVSERNVDRALEVLEHGTPKLQAAVKSGTVSVSDAAEIVDEPAKVQNKAVKDVAQGKAPTAQAAVKAQILCLRCSRIGKETPPIGKEHCSACETLRQEAKPKTAKKPKPESNGKPIPTDSFGTELPKRCRGAFCDPWIEETQLFLESISEQVRMKKIITGMEKRAKVYPFFDSKDFIDGVGFTIQYLDQLIKHLRDFAPAGVCPACDGEGCGGCKMTGLVPRDVYTKLKKEKVTA